MNRPFRFKANLLSTAIIDDIPSRSKIKYFIVKGHAARCVINDVDGNKYLFLINLKRGGPECGLRLAKWDRFIARVESWSHNGMELWNHGIMEACRHCHSGFIFEVI